MKRIIIVLLLMSIFMMGCNSDSKSESQPSTSNNKTNVDNSANNFTNDEEVVDTIYGYYLLNRYQNISDEILKKEDMDMESGFNCFIYLEPDGNGLISFSKSATHYDGWDMKWKDNKIMLQSSGGGMSTDEEVFMSYEIQNNELFVDIDSLDNSIEKINKNEKAYMILVKVKDEEEIKRLTKMKSDIIVENNAYDDDNHYGIMMKVLSTIITEPEIINSLGSDHSYQFVFTVDGVIISYDKKVITKENPIYIKLLAVLGSDFEYEYRKKIQDENSYIIDIDSEGNVLTSKTPEKYYGDHFYLDVMDWDDLHLKID